MCVKNCLATSSGASFCQKYISKPTPIIPAIITIIIKLLFGLTPWDGSSGGVGFVCCCCGSVGSVDDAIGCPHDEQNLLDPVISFPHSEQKTLLIYVSSLPFSLMIMCHFSV